jgi:RHS repeat-associated protein
VAMQRAGSKVFFHHFDHNGNTVALTDASGTVSATYRYSPYGQILSQTGAVDNPFTYVGAYGVMDEGDGIYLMRHRHYDALTGRFLKKDPIGIEGGLNLYEYAEGNPLLMFDPFGTYSQPMGNQSRLTGRSAFNAIKVLYNWLTSSKCPASLDGTTRANQSEYEWLQAGPELDYQRMRVRKDPVELDFGCETVCVAARADHGRWSNMLWRQDDGTFTTEPPEWKPFSWKSFLGLE